MHRLIRRSTIPAVFVLALLLAACPKNPNPNPTPHETAVFNATQAIDKLTLAKNIIVDLNHSTPPIINDHVEGILLDIDAALATIIGATPDGWLAAAQAAFDVGKAKLTPAEQQQYAAYLALIQVALSVAK